MYKIIYDNLNKMMNIVFVGFLLIVFGSLVQPAVLSREEVHEMLGCTFHTAGEWVDPSLYRDGSIRFSYVLEPVTGDKSHPLYVAFWNSRRSGGKLIEFMFSRNGSRKQFSIVNDGWIVDNNGKLDVKDTLFGLYTYKHIKSKLPILKEQKEIAVRFDEIKPTNAACSSPLTN